MNKNKNHTFKITEDSLLRLNEISQSMDGTTFHKYTHILYDIRTELGDNPITYLEIGSYAGASISLISSHPFPTKCFSVDLGTPISPTTVDGNVNKFKNEKSTFEYIQGNSQSVEVINKVINIVEKIDILFIDGDHSYNGVISDYNNYKIFVNDGGYIVFDDYIDLIYSPEVKIAVDDLIDTFKEDGYDIIGAPSYSLLDKLNSPSSPISNLFVIKKKSKS